MFSKHPKGLIPAALANMGERFGYYIMNAVLLLFLVSKFGLSDSTAGVIYAVFYFGIYVLSLVGGIIADRTQNYNRTIQWGLIIMALGYIALSIPVFSDVDFSGTWWAILVFTCMALLCIAFGNGLFKGNLQAIVGKMYDELEEEAAKEGEEALRQAREKRDSGFQIFYVFINIGGLVAPFVAPLLRQWWLGKHLFTYNADMPALCHQYLHDGVVSEKFMETMQLAAQNASSITDLSAFSHEYLTVFNQGIHYSFIASVAAMLLSLIIFLATKRMFPQPEKKSSAAAVEYTPEEKQAMAKEIKQRMYALFAVLGVVIFFWLSFHQNGQSLSVFARDFVKTDSVAPEIWQALNPFFVIVLTPVVMWFFSFMTKRNKGISTPRKIVIGMAVTALAYLFLAVFSALHHYPSGEVFRQMNASEMSAAGLTKAGPWVLIVTYFFLTVAELFISPLGLSFVSKVAPRHLAGLCQGLWLGATAVGNLMIWIGPTMYNAWDIQYCWLVFFGICVVSMSVMLGMVKWLEKVAC